MKGLRGRTERERDYREERERVRDEGSTGKNGEREREGLQGRRRESER